MRNKIKFIISAIIIVSILITCTSNSKEEYYIDYNEALQYSDSSIITSLKEVNQIFKVFNDEDTVFLVRSSKRRGIGLKLMDYDRIEFISMDAAIGLMAKNKVDSIISKKKLPDFFLVKQDSLDGTIKLISIKQVYALSKDDFSIWIRKIEVKPVKNLSGPSINWRG